MRKSIIVLFEFDKEIVICLAYYKVVNAHSSINMLVLLKFIKGDLK